MYCVLPVHLFNSGHYFHIFFRYPILMVSIISNQLYSQTITLALVYYNQQKSHLLIQGFNPAWYSHHHTRKKTDHNINYRNHRNNVTKTKRPAALHLCLTTFCRPSTSTELDQCLVRQADEYNIQARDTTPVLEWLTLVSTDYVCCFITFS